MFGTFRRHQKWIWILGVIVIIPSFVIFFTPTVGNGPTPGGGGAGDPFYMNGKPVTIAGRPISQRAVSEALRETMLSYFIRSGGREWPQMDDRLRQEAVFRVFLLGKLKEMEIEVSEKAAAQVARDRLGNFPFDKFESEILRPKGLNADDFERFARHEAAIQQLVGVAAMSAKLITPSEAEFIYRQENEEVVTDVAVFWTSNYLGQVTASPEEVAKYYTNSMGRYRVPERMQISYVEFPASNYLAEADQRMSKETNLTARIDEIYFQLGTNYYRDTNDVALSEEAAKEKIKDQMRHNEAILTAHQAANGFGSELMSMPNPNEAGNLDKLAAEKGMPVKVTEPFSRFEGFEDLGLPEGFLQAALQLNSTNRSIAFDPVRGSNAVYILAYKNKVPSSIPPLDDIREKVVKDLQEAEASKLARSAATNFYAVLTNGMAQGKSFSELAVQEKVVLETPPPFAPSTTTLTNLDPRIDLRRLQMVVRDMDPGNVSRYIPTRDGALIVHLRDKLPIDETRMKEGLPELMMRLRQYRRSEAFNQWFSKEAQRAPLVIPQEEPESPPT